MYGVKLVLILIIVGGLIAYVGDKIGMKVGRKRLSLFGLRPKYTSIIITVVTGILIAISCLLLLMVASENVRMALFDMNALLERLDNLNNRLTVKNQDLFQLRADIENKIKNLTLLQEDKARLQQNLSTIKGEYQKIKESKLKLQSKVEKLDLQKEGLTKQVNNLAHNLSLFGKRYLHSLTGDILYQKGEVIFGRSINVEQSEDRLKVNMNELLQEAELVAMNVGVNRRDGQELLDYNQQELEKVIEILKKREGRVIVRLVAAQNTLKTDRLAVDFDLYQDYQVYQQQDTILQYELMATDNLVDIEQELNQLLVDLNHKAIQDGILPNTKGEVGELSLVKLYPLIERLLEKEGAQKVRVIANNDIWRGEELTDNIKFKLMGR